jgi:hypothetical protein
MKKHILILITSVVVLVGLSACQADFRPEARGGFSEVLVVMDSSKVNSKTATALRNTFGAPLMTLPRPEPRFDLVFRDLRTTQDIDLMQSHKNVIVVATLDEDSNVGTYMRSILAENVKESVRQGRSFYFTHDNLWARNQWVLILTSTSDEELAEKILNNESRLMANLREKELERWHAYVYRRAEQVDLSNEILERHGWTFRIQHDYRVGADTLNFMTFRRYLHDNDRWIWVWWKDDFHDFDEIDKDWINNTRDSLNQHFIKGSVDEKFVTTEYRRAIEHRFLTLSGKNAFETRGRWTMVNDLMGGPFVNYTFYDEENNRLYMMEYAQFAPRWDLRRFVYQFEAMARTFVSDPSAIIEESSDPS